MKEIINMDSYQRKIKQILIDKSHGSSFLLQEILDVFINFEYSVDELRLAYSKLRAIDQTMVIIHHFLSELEPKIGHDFRKHVQDYQNRWQDVNIDITKNLQGYLPDQPFTILTHSHSGVFIEVLKNLYKEGYAFDVIQTESLPAGEGRIQAKTLKQLGLKVTLINDDSIINIMNNVTCCFLGVDQYDENSFVNKIGSKNIVDIAFQANIPVFVLGDKRKKVSRIQLGTSDLFDRVSLRSNVRILTS